MVEAIDTVQRTFKTLKPDLRPNSGQNHPQASSIHRPSPLPTLRKTLIMHQEEIDDDEFFQNLLTGLVCWGSAGIGRKDRDDSSGSASTGSAAGKQGCGFCRNIGLYSVERMENWYGEMSSSAVSEGRTVEIWASNVGSQFSSLRIPYYDFSIR